MRFWRFAIPIASVRYKRIIIITRMLLLQATVKRFQFDLYVTLEGQQMLISLCFQNKSLRTDKVNQTAQSTVKSSNFHAFRS